MACVKLAARRPRSGPTRVSQKAFHVKHRVVAVVNQKGGVGKTTTAVTLGGLLSERKQRVLLLDLDPHGSMTSYFGYDPDNLQKSSFNFFLL